MPVTLLTGLPGSGKTAQLVKRILELREKEPGRPVFQMGIRGLKEGLAADLTMDQLMAWWEELPAGSIICLDECQEDHLMPKDRGNPLPWVQKITKVRHFGMDFILTTQHPANMSAYVRRLVDDHVHAVMRSKGVRQTYRWMRCMDDPDGKAAKKSGEMSFSPLPKETFDLFTSSTLHTMKVRTPRKMYMIAAALVIAAILAVVIPYRLKKATHEVPKLAGAAAAAQSESDALRTSDYPKWSTPRIAGLPWSAPMFDKLTVKANPRVFCIAVDDGRCSCLSEQGTKYDVPAATCRSIAANGVYDPFLDPSGKREGDRSTADRESGHRREAASPPADGRVSVAGVPGPVAVRAMSEPYQPPTYGHFSAEGASAPSVAPAAQ